DLKTSANLLVIDDNKGGGIFSGGVYDDLGGMMGVKSNVDNEVEILKTYDLMREVVAGVDGHIVYMTKGRVKSMETLDPPYRLEVITPADSIFKTVEFELQIDTDRGLKIKNKDFELDVPVGELFAIPDLGYVRLQRNEEELLTENGTYTQKIIVRPPSSVTADYRSRLTVGVTNKQTSTIDLSFDYPVPRKGERILQTLIDRYVERTLEDKNTVADRTLAFINDRLLFVGN